MSTFLQLGQQLVSECGASNVTLTTMQSLTGEASRFANWIQSAWQELQTERDDWNFLRSSNLLGAGASFVTVNGQASYALGSGAGTTGITAAGFGKWDRNSFRNYTTTVGTTNENFLASIDYDEWRNGYMLGAMRGVTTRPVVVAIGPDESVCLGPPPNALYTITGDYFLAPTQMVNDTDVPTGLPAQFHRLIVYKAMGYYAQYESAPDVWQRSALGWNTLLPQLQAIKTPRITFAGALA